MEWGSTKQPHLNPVAGQDYEVEHIMEWQLVTKFFDYLDHDHFGGRAQFTDPDPAQNGAQIGFCDYWTKTWNNQRFTIAVNGNTPRTAQKHLAWQFLGVEFKDTD